MAKALQKEDSTIEPITLDTKDILILKLLQKNARINSAITH